MSLRRDCTMVLEPAREIFAFRTAPIPPTCSTWCRTTKRTWPNFRNRPRAAAIPR